MADSEGSWPLPAFGVGVPLGLALLLLILGLRLELLRLLLPVLLLPLLWVRLLRAGVLRRPVLVRTGDAALWIGHVRREGREAVKLPATIALRHRLAHVPVAPADDREIGYRRIGPVGVLSFAFHSGAMSTRQSRLASTVSMLAGQRTVRSASNASSRRRKIEPNTLDIAVTGNR